MVKEFTHQLVESFKYSANGTFHEAEIITVKAPKNTDFYNNVQFLDSLCNKSQMRSMKNLAGVLKELDMTQDLKEKAQEQNLERDEEEKALDAYNELMAGLEREEINQLNIAITEMMKKSAMVDGSKNFEETFWDELGMEDRRLLIGKYIENFTVTSQRKSKNQ